MAKSTVADSEARPASARQVREWLPMTITRLGAALSTPDSKLHHPALALSLKYT